MLDSGGRETLISRSRSEGALGVPNHTSSLTGKRVIDADHGSKPGEARRTRFALFGHFGSGNFGNESTLQAMLYNIRRLVQDADIVCICTRPERVAAEYNITTKPVNPTVSKPWKPGGPLVRSLRKLIIGIPSELYRWFDGLRTLLRTDAVLIVGTGLLTDAFMLDGWGPYSTFKFSVLARLSRCRLFFVSVGAGPLTRPAGKFLVNTALALADFRSYRDRATQRYLESVGFRRSEDRVYPDLAFSLPSGTLPERRASTLLRPVVGLGLMEHRGMYGIQKTTTADYTNYKETLAVFAKWLLDRGYDIRLLIGDLADQPAVEELKSLLWRRLTTSEQERVAAERIASTEDLFEQIADTDFVVGTRFHNVLLALLFNKPSIAISFHHKCSALMEEIGLPEYCIDIKKLTYEDLTNRFCALEKDAAAVKEHIAKKVSEYSKALDEQYAVMFSGATPRMAASID